MSTDTTNCPHCTLPISVNATRCQHCHGAILTKGKLKDIITNLIMNAVVFIVIYKGIMWYIERLG